jgi:hypothetical protein
MVGRLTADDRGIPLITGRSGTQRARDCSLPAVPAVAGREVLKGLAVPLPAPDWCELRDFRAGLVKAVFACTCAVHLSPLTGCPAVTDGRLLTCGLW